jgi:hypothetical protein
LFLLFIELEWKVDEVPFSGGGRLGAKIILEEFSLEEIMFGGAEVLNFDCQLVP